MSEARPCAHCGRMIRAGCSCRGSLTERIAVLEADIETAGRIATASGDARMILHARVAELEGLLREAKEFVLDLPTLEGSKVARWHKDACEIVRMAEKALGG